jgi:hypothetical protein
MASGQSWGLVVRGSESAMARHGAYYAQHSQIYSHTSRKLNSWRCHYKARTFYNILELSNILKFVPLSPDLSRCPATTGSLQYLPMGMKKNGERCWHVLYITQGRNHANGSLAIVGDIQLTTLTLGTQALSRNQNIKKNKVFHRVSRLPLSSP